MVTKKRFCGQCGSETSASDKFCTSCGSGLATTSEESATHSLPTPQVVESSDDSDELPGANYDGGMGWMDKKGAFIVPDVPPPEPMTFVEAIKHCFRNYANFRGRASRSEYWYFLSLFLLSAIGIAVVEELRPSLRSTEAIQRADLATLGFIVLILAMIVPSMAAGVRRLHDTGHSAAWLLLNVIPFGGIVILAWLCQAGDDAPNRFGPPA